VSDRTATRRGPSFRTAALWTTGLAVGLAGGWAVLTVSPLEGFAELVLWVWLARQAPRYVGLAGAVVGTGISWLALIGTSSAACTLTAPIRCEFSLAYGPGHVGNLAEWQSDTRDWMDYALIILAIGIILTIWTARRSRRAAAAAIAEAAEAANPVWHAPTKPIVQTRPDSSGPTGSSGSTAAASGASSQAEDPPA
jgi:hypothetical protein